MRSRDAVGDCESQTRAITATRGVSAGKRTEKLIPAKRFDAIPGIYYGDAQ